MSEIKLSGELVEICMLEEGGEVDGLVIRRADGSYVRVTGLRTDEVRALAPLFLEAVAITVGAPA